MAIAQTSHAGDKILVVLSEAKQLSLQNEKTYETGFYLNELMIPVSRLIEVGYKIVFATPHGKLPHMDLSSDDIRYFGGNSVKYESIKALFKKLQLLEKKDSPVVSLSSLSDHDLSKFSALFVPGGHAPMVDLVTEPKMGRVLKRFHLLKKPTALICHAPIVLLSTLDQSKKYVDAITAGDMASAKVLSKNWIYAGYHFTVFSTPEEISAESGKLGGKLKYYPEDALKTAGAIPNQASKWKSNVVESFELITGQNPSSDEELTERLIKKLKPVLN